MDCLCGSDWKWFKFFRLMMCLCEDRGKEKIIKAAFGRRENWTMMEYQCNKKYCRNGQ